MKKYAYKLLIIGLLFLILGPNIFNICPSVLCENDTVMDAPDTQEKNNMFIAASLFAITTILYILYIKNGGNPPTAPSSFGDISEKIAPVLDTATKSHVVLQREVVASVNIPPRHAFINPNGIELAKQVYQQTKEIAELTDKIAGLRNQLNSSSATIYELHGRVIFLVEQNKNLSNVFQDLVGFTEGLFKKYPNLPSSELRDFMAKHPPKV